MQKRWGCLFIMLVSALNADCEQIFVLKDHLAEVALDTKGNLISLKNMATGQEYAGGFPMWRLYFDRKDGQKENEILATGNLPEIQQGAHGIEMTYSTLLFANKPLKMRLKLTVTLNQGHVCFASEVANEEPHTIIRELQYPLVGNCPLPADYQLLTTHLGGKLFNNPKQFIVRTGNNPPYMAPSQYYRQFDLKYPAHTVANCFAFVGPSQGLYFGSHDPTFQDTWHGLRVYPDAAGAFTRLEAGLYKYPNCLAGQTWTCKANTIIPYSGSWHETAKIYRKWADIWWHQREVPLWVRKMKGWQRVIFRHQYGETLFTYADLDNRMRKAGESVGVETVLAFGWWQSGMDNGYPDSYFITDPQQGGDAGWRKAIADFQGHKGRLLLYFNGKLIDRESAYYRTGEGKSVCYCDNTGAHYTEQYRFKAHGTFTGHHNTRTFVVADARQENWRAWLLKMADRAINFGTDGVFYDQLGYCEPTCNWDVKGEFAIPNTCVIADKAKTLKLLHDHLDKHAKPDFALGTECFTDVTAQHVDYVHNLTGATGPTDFTEWVRYAFPEVVFSDREIRDDTDIPRRVNHAMLKGLRNDIEIYRCRDLIDKTPLYQHHLAEVNRLKDKYCDVLLLGRYRDTDGLVNANPKVLARCYAHGSQMGVVVTQSSEAEASTRIRIPGYTFRESDSTGNVTVQPTADGWQTVKIERHGLAVLIFEKE